MMTRYVWVSLQFYFTLSSAKWSYEGHIYRNCTLKYRKTGLIKTKKCEVSKQNFLDTHILGTIKFIEQVGLECEEGVKKDK